MKQFVFVIALMFVAPLIHAEPDNFTPNEYDFTTSSEANDFTPSSEPNDFTPQDYDFKPSSEPNDFTPNSEK